MTLQEFQSKIESIRAKNGWTITLECHSTWTVTVFDKESGIELASTGSTGLHAILKALEMPFDKCPWV